MKGCLLGASGKGEAGSEVLISFLCREGNWDIFWQSPAEAEAGVGQERQKLKVVSLNMLSNPLLILKKVLIRTFSRLWGFGSCFL